MIDLSGKTKKGYGPDKVMVQTSFAEKKQNKKQKKKSN
jgi:hypothetical protein